jgi:hypothetical protein
MAATTDGVSWVEREVTRKGKTYKQWFRVKSGGGAAAPPPTAKAAAPTPKAPKAPKAEAKPKSAAARLMGAKDSPAPGKAKPVTPKQLAGNADAALKQAGIKGKVTKISKDGLDAGFTDKQQLPMGSPDSNAAVRVADKKFTQDIDTARNGLGKDWVESFRGKPGTNMHEVSFTMNDGAQTYTLTLRRSVNLRDGQVEYLKDMRASRNKNFKGAAIEQD